VYKVGAQSGTTGGTVIDTCTDVSFLSDGTMFTLLCAGRVRLSAMGGGQRGARALSRLQREHLRGWYLIEWRRVQHVL